VHIKLYNKTASPSREKLYFINVHIWPKFV